MINPRPLPSLASIKTSVDSILLQTHTKHKTSQDNGQQQGKQNGGDVEVGRDDTVPASIFNGTLAESGTTLEGGGWRANPIIVAILMVKMLPCSRRKGLGSKRQ